MPFSQAMEVKGRQADSGYLGARLRVACGGAGGDEDGDVDGCGKRCLPVFGGWRGVGLEGEVEAFYIFLSAYVTYVPAYHNTYLSARNFSHDYMLC